MANQNNTGKTLPKTKLYTSADTFFIPQTDASAGSGFDMATMFLTQASASVTALLCDADREEFSLSHKYVINLLWGVQTQLEMAEAALSHMDKAEQRQREHLATMQTQP